MQNSEDRSSASTRPPAWLLVGGFLVLAFVLPTPGSSAAPPKPWSPPVDSVWIWSAEAKAQFKKNLGDSATGPNLRAYELVGRMGRRMLRELGREGFGQVQVVENVLDSVGLVTEVYTDPSTPLFTLLVVRNPFQPKANTVGYLYWYRGDDLRMQGVVMRGGYSPRMRVWWTGHRDGPYEWGILDQERDPEGWLGLILLRLAPDATHWEIVQYESGNSDLGRSGEAYWNDINGDELPEVVTWSKALADSTFEECAGCPRLLTERVFVRRENGFELQDSRLLPSAYSTFVLFIRLLREHNRPAASRLLENPDKVDDAIALGWDASRRAPGQWKLEYGEPDQPWPRWLAIRHDDGKQKPLYIVHFTQKDARWIIRDWAVSTGRGGKRVEVGSKSK